MKIFKVNPENLRESKEAVEEAARIIRLGGTIIFPTDTVYGLGCDATSESAVKKVFKIKNRSRDKPVPVIITDLEMAKKLACFDAKIEEMLLSVWPGSITILLEKKQYFFSNPEMKLADMVVGGKKTIALRIPDYKITHFLAIRCGVPLVATSANISGSPASTKINEVLEQFEKNNIKPDLVLDAGDLKFSQASTILDLSKGKPMITRVGAVNKKKLFEIIGI